MVWFRLVFGTLLVLGLVCFVMYLSTRQDGWRRRGIALVKWTMLAAFGFFAVLIVQRLLEGT
jgi:hypothetical protein